MSIRSHRSATAFALSLSTLAILVATLYSSGTALPLGWTFYIATGDQAVAEVIQNLLLFMPFGASLKIAGMRPGHAIATGSALSFTVEFLQQWIPGRDPSLGDIVCNTVGTALGVLLVVSAPIWLWAPPRRSALQALAAAALAVLVWIGTGVVLQPIFPPPPLREVGAPEAPALSHWDDYPGKILGVTYAQGVLRVEAVAPSVPPHRGSPLAAIVNPQNTNAVILAVYGTDLELRYHMPAVRLRLSQPPLRWRGALAAIAPGDTFTAATGHEGGTICMLVNHEWRCGLGYTIGDGWKLIFYPEHWPDWQLRVINTLWIAGCVVGVGYWAARGRGRRGGGVAIAIVIAALLMVPLVTGLKATPIHEWIGALGGLALGWFLFRERQLSYESPHPAAGYTAPPSHPAQTS